MNNEQGCSRCGANCGAVRCGAVNFGCGAVRCAIFGRACGAVRCGARFFKMICGAVRCGVRFSKFIIFQSHFYHENYAYFSSKSLNYVFRSYLEAI